jgi:hypothetical protein
MVQRPLNQRGRQTVDSILTRSVSFEVARFVHDVPSPPIHLRIWFVVKRLHLVANELGERAG